MKNFKQRFIEKVASVTCEVEESVSKKYDDIAEHLEVLTKEVKTYCIL